MDLDDRNLRILEILQKEGRKSNLDLANEVALSPSACLTRVKWLEDNGYIKGYRVRLDLEKLGPVLTAFLEVTMGSHFPEDFRKFNEFIASCDEVVESFVVGAHFDFMLQVVVSDMTALRTLSNRILEADLGVVKLNTIPAIERSIPFTGYPVAKLAGRASAE